MVSSGRYTSELQVDSSQVDRVAVGASVAVSVSTGSSSGRGGFNFPAFGSGNANRNGNSGNGDAGNGNAANGNTTNGAAGGATATGTVTEVGKIADASSGVAQYPVTIAFSTDDASFSVGTSITGAISSTIKDDVLTVPVRAVSTENGESTVTVALDGTTDRPDRDGQGHDG